MSIQDALDDRDSISKSRSHANEEYYGREARYNSDGTVRYDNVYDGAASGWHQQTVSTYTPNYYRRMKANRGRDRVIGGPFFTRRVTLKPLGAYPHLAFSRLHSNGVPSYLYEGIVFPNTEVRRIARAIHNASLMNDPIWTSSSALSIPDLRATGERIMLSTVPTKSELNSLVSLGELLSERKFFSTPGAALSDANPGGEFLNYQFGILPVVSDVKAFHKALSDAEATIAQYRRDSGRKIRRKAGPYTIKDETVVTTGTGALLSPNHSITGWLNGGSWKSTKNIKREVWYSGAFKYYIPENLSRLEELLFEWNRSYGIVPDPSDIWELLPFSWLTDWFTNSGNMVNHLFLQASEGATQIYGFVMCHTTVVNTVTWTGTVQMNSVSQPFSVSWEIREDIKQRQRVLPFGTTYTGKELTARQLAILGALGIAR